MPITKFSTQKTTLVEKIKSLAEWQETDKPMIKIKKLMKAAVSLYSRDRDHTIVLNYVATSIKEDFDYDSIHNKYRALRAYLQWQQSQQAMELMDAIALIQPELMKISSVDNVGFLQELMLLKTKGEEASIRAAIANENAWDKKTEAEKAAFILNQFVLKKPGSIHVFLASYMKDHWETNAIQSFVDYLNANNSTLLLTLLREYCPEASQAYKESYQVVRLFEAYLPIEKARAISKLRGLAFIYHTKQKNPSLSAKELLIQLIAQYQGSTHQNLAVLVMTDLHGGLKTAIALKALEKLIGNTHSIEFKGLIAAGIEHFSPQDPTQKEIDGYCKELGTRVQANKETEKAKFFLSAYQQLSMFEAIQREENSQQHQSEIQRQAVKNVLDNYQGTHRTLVNLICNDLEHKLGQSLAVIMYAIKAQLKERNSVQLKGFVDAVIAYYDLKTPDDQEIKRYTLWLSEKLKANEVSTGYPGGATFR